MSETPRPAWALTTAGAKERQTLGGAALTVPGLGGFHRPTLRTGIVNRNALRAASNAAPTGQESHSMTLTNSGGRTSSTAAPPEAGGAGAGEAHLEVRDSRTGRDYKVPIEQGAIHARDLGQMHVLAEDHGLLSYDPAFLNTASCRSAI